MKTCFFPLFQTAVKRFASIMKYRYNGAILASLSLAAGGKSISINIQDNEAVGYGSFGKFLLDFPAMFFFKNLFKVQKIGKFVFSKIDRLVFFIVHGCTTH